MIAGILGGKALGAGLGAIQNWMAGEDKEKQEKKEAMRELYNRYMSGGNMMQFGRKPQENPGMGEYVGGALLAAGADTAAKPPEMDEDGNPKEDWYQQAAKGYLGAAR